MSHQRPPARAVYRLAIMVALLPLPTAWAQAPVPIPAQTASPPWFQGFAIGLGQWSGALALESMNGLQSVSALDAGNTRNLTSAFSESLKIGNNFYVINPLLLKGSLGLDMQLRQDKSDGTGYDSANTGKVMGYVFSATVLEQKPYTAALFANRTQVQSLQSSGGLVVGVIENRSAWLHLHEDSIFYDWGYPWLWANLGIEQEKNHSTTRSFGLSQTTDEQSRRFSFDVSKGFPTADLNFGYQVRDQQNASFAQSNFQSNAASVRYSLDFGPTLNRRFDSLLNYSARNGIAPATSFSDSEHLRIDHYKNLNTDYKYDVTQQNNNGTTGSVQKGEFSVSHQWYQDLSNRVSLDAARTTVPNGSSTSYGTQLGQNYSHGLPREGRLSLDWSGGYRLTNNQLGVASLNVIDEVHVAESPLTMRTGFLLSHPFVLAASLQVLNVMNGGRIPLRNVADAPPGQGDYEVMVENNQLRIVPLPTSLRLSAGDELAISYSYQVDAKLESRTKSSGFGVGVSYGWISVMLRHRQSNQTPLNQTSSLFLQNTQQNSMRLALKGRVLKLATHADLDIESNKTTDIANDKSHLGAGLVWETEWLRTLLDVNASTEKYTLPDQHTTATRTARSSVQWSNMSMIVGVNASDSTYTWPVQRTDSLLAAQTSLNWYTMSGWTHSAALDWSQRQMGDTPPETLEQAIVKSSITAGKLSLNASLGLGQWLRAGNRSANRSFYISAVRQL